MPPPPTRLRLSDFPNSEAVFENLRGRDGVNDIAVRPTHEGLVVSGLLPRSNIPGHMKVLGRFDGDADDAAADDDYKAGDAHRHQRVDYSSPSGFSPTPAAAATATSGALLGLNKSSDSSFSNQSLLRQHSSASTLPPPPLEQEGEEEEEHAPPPKSLAWLHKLIEDFFEFRSRQFAIKRSINNGDGGVLSFAVSDDDDAARRMVVPNAITDDVAFHLFEMISERYGVPTVVAQHSEVALQTAKFFSRRDVTAALFFALLKTPSFDSNDVRFVVEAKRHMRSSLVSQRGVDGVVRWFIPLRCVSGVLRKCAQHPWARPVLAKVHSAFDKLFRNQKIKNRDMQAQQEQKQQQQQQQQELSSRYGNRSRVNAAPTGVKGGPLFTLPAPQNLSLVPPFSESHPLIGRGPFVDVRANESFLTAQPPQLVIGADYLLCMLFVNWLDQRELALSAAAEGKPLEYVAQRRTGRVVGERTLAAEEALSWNKLSMFAIPEEGEETVGVADEGARKKISLLDELRLAQQQSGIDESNSKAFFGVAAQGAEGGAGAAAAGELASGELDGRSEVESSSAGSQQQNQQHVEVAVRQKSARQLELERQRKDAAMVPPRILHFHV